MKKVGFIISIVALPLAMFAYPIVYLNDNFSDNDRTNQDLPSSAQWFGSFNNLSVVETTPGNYALKNAPTSTALRSGTAYFAPAGSPVTLAAGESIILTFDVTPTTRDPEAGPNTLRFGLLYSDEARLMTDENPNLSVTGYGLFYNPDTTVSGFREKLDKEAALWTSLAAGNWSGTFGGDELDPAMDVMKKDTTYSIEFSITRKEDGSLDFFYSLSDGTTSGSVTANRSSNPIYSFDTVGFCWSNAFGDGLIENVQVTLSREAGLPGFYDWAAGYGLFDSDAGPGFDYDGDGFVNWQEYIADTDPTRADSFFSAGAVTREGSVSTVSFFSSLNRVYELWFTPNLTGEPEWERVQGPRPGIGDTDLMIHEQEEETASGFYRLRVLLPVPE